MPLSSNYRGQVPTNVARLNAHRALPICAHGALPQDRQIAMSVTAALAKVREHKQQLKAAAKGWLCSHGLYSEVAEEGVHLDPEGLVVSVDRSPGGGDAIAAPYCYEPGNSRLRRANSSSTSKPGEVAAGGSPVGCCRDASMEGRARRSSRCCRRC
jgi:hypothetical protein